MGHLCAFRDCNRGRSPHDIAVADRGLPFERNVIAAALGCYLTPVCIPGDLGPDLPLQHSLSLIQESDHGFLSVGPFGPSAVDRALRGIPVRERTPPWNRIFDSDYSRLFVAQLIVWCRDNPAIESVLVSTRDARHGILAMSERPRQLPGSSYAYTQPKSVVNRKVEWIHDN
jgi:hypothetical protein